jgi:hypothetical protein
MPNSNNINLVDLYQQVWGITPVVVVGNMATGVQYAAGIAANNAIYNKQAVAGYDFKDIQVVDSSAPILAYSASGTPISEQIAFTMPLPGGKKEYILPGWPLFDITGSNVIEKTPNRGRKGTVKEFIYEDDYQITIRGFLVNETDDSYPESQLQSLMQLINTKAVSGVKSQVFTAMGINNIVIERWSLPAVEGFPSIQPFELNCLSDEPESLVIKGKLQKTINTGL